MSVCLESVFPLISFQSAFKYCSFLFCTSDLDLPCTKAFSLPIVAEKVKKGLQELLKEMPSV